MSSVAGGLFCKELQPTFPTSVFPLPFHVTSAQALNSQSLAHGEAACATGIVLVLLYCQFQCMGLCRCLWFGLLFCCLCFLKEWLYFIYFLAFVFLIKDWHRPWNVLRPISSFLSSLQPSRTMKSCINPPLSLSLNWKPSLMWWLHFVSWAIVTPAHYLITLTITEGRIRFCALCPSSSSFCLCNIEERNNCKTH